MLGTSFYIDHVFRRLYTIPDCCGGCHPANVFVQVYGNVHQLFDLIVKEVRKFILFRTICRYMAQGPKYSKDNRIDGKVVIVTGANSGMGKEVALELARRGGKVYLACRDRAKGEEVCRQIIDKTGNPNVFCRVLDLSSFESIRSFVKEYVSLILEIDFILHAFPNR